MKRVFIYLVLSLSLWGQIMITEVMYNPAGADSPNEFVEIYNTSDFPADISGWSIADLAATDRLLDSAGAADINLPSRTYAVIFEGDYDGLMYQDLVPDSTLILFTHTTTIGNTLGNTSDSLFLLDSSGVTVAHTGWNEPVPAGFSRERIRLDYPDQATNWAISRDSLGTPGAENSVRPNTIDGAILTDSLNINPPVINSNETTTLSVLVANIGRETFNGLLLVTADTSTLASAALPELAEMETLRVVIDIVEINSGSHTWLVRLEIAGDEDSTNNSGYITLGVRYQPGILTINEFLAAPLTGHQEFVELVHLGTTPINLRDWRITDNYPGEAYQFSVVTAPSGSFIVVAPDSSLLQFCPPEATYIVPPGGFPSLNNGGDQIRLFDPFNTLIDSLTYDSDWDLQSGLSNEKLQPHLLASAAVNWRLSVDSTGFTPGRPNSVTPRQVDGSIIANLTQHAPHYPEENEPVWVTACITNSGLAPILSRLILSETDFEIGQVTIPTLAAAETTCVQFNLPGFTPGIHFIDLYLELPGDLNPDDNWHTDTVAVRYQFGTVKINEFLAQPIETQTEFVELVSFANLNLKNWGISDNNLTKRYFPPIDLLAGAYILVAPDSSWLSYLPEDVQLISPLDGWPTLNNTADAIYLYDHTGKIIDSLHYSDNWSLTPGRSLEKLRPELKSNEFLNWGTAVNPDGFTPGQSNSIYYESVQSKGKVIYAPNPFSPDSDGYEDQLVIHYQLPYELAYLKLEIFDAIGRNIAQPSWNVPVAREGILTWDGYRSNGKRARVGIYIIKLTAADQHTNKTWEDVQTVVVAKRL